MMRIKRYLLSLLLLCGFILILAPDAVSQRKRRTVVDEETTSQNKIGASQNAEKETKKSLTEANWERKFQKGISLYLDEQYQASEILFKECADAALPASDQLDLSLLWKAKALIQLEKYAEATGLLSSLESSPTAGALKLQIAFDNAALTARQQHFASAAQQFARLIPPEWTRLNPDKDLALKAYQYLDLLSAAHLTISELQALSNNAANVAVKVLAECAAAEKRFYLGAMDSALARLADVKKRVSDLDATDSKRLESLISLAAQLKNKSAKTLRIGVLLPFQVKPFDNSVDIGSSNLMLGVHFGAEEANRLLPNGVALLSYRNTAKRSPEEIVSLAKSLIDTDSVQIILGPMFSPEALAVSHYCASRQIPMITPTATDESISKVSPLSFQLNPTHEARGAAMARFAFENLNARTVGVFVQDSTYSKEMGEGFKAEIERQGGTVKVFGVLPPKFSSFSKALSPLGLRFDEETGYPQTRLDAIYLPLTSPDAVAIAISQLRFYNISGELLGSSDWLDKRLLSNRDLLTSFYYASDFQLSDNSSTNLITAAFKSRFGVAPASLFWLGFDAITYLTTVAFTKNISLTIDKIIKTSPLIELHHSPIDFTGGNINRAMSIIRFTNGIMARVK